MYKLRRGHKCSGSKCEGAEEEKGLRVQIFLSGEYSGIWRAFTEHTYLIKMSFHSFKSPLWDTLRGQMSS